MERARYPYDLADADCQRLQPHLSREYCGGRQRSVDEREIAHTVLYLVHTGCAGRALPYDLPKWQSAYAYLRRWEADGSWERALLTLRRTVRVQARHNHEPRAGSIDSQSVNPTEAGGPRGSDAGKTVSGRKRHLVVDTLGLPPAVVVTAAHLSGVAGGRQVLSRARDGVPQLRLPWADHIYTGVNWSALWR